LIGGGNMGKKPPGGKKNLFLLLVNVFCITALVAIFANYSSGYRQKLYDQNVNSIGNLNKSSATVAEAMFSYYAQKLSDMSRYIEANEMNLEDALSYLQCMSADTSGRFELIGTDSSGYVLGAGENGAAVAIAYKDNSYSELHQIFKNAADRGANHVLYTPEFTDAFSAFKCFAFYDYVNVEENGAGKSYTLMFVARSSDLVAKIQQSGNYNDLSTALIDMKGNYIIGNSDFKSENLFKYLYVFNGLTLDQMNSLSGEVLSTDAGTLLYKNSAGKDCVFVYTRQTDAKWYSVSCVPVDSFENNLYGNQLIIWITVILSVLMFINVFSLNKMNRVLKLAAIREKNANEAKSEFLSRVSHDIRTPLNAILGFASITADDSRLAPDLKENLRKINDSGHYLLGILNDVLDMSKIESGKVELRERSENLTRLFNDVLSIFSGEAKRAGITIRTDFELRENEYFIIDSLRTKQIFSNLLSNAIKFSESGTEIYWSVHEEPDEDGRSKIVSVIRDQGRGMSKEFLDKLYEPFTREEGERSDEITGTGLGLAIVKRLVSLMEGTILVESAPGKGTKFTVTIPFRRGEAEVEKNMSMAADDSGDNLRGKRVLICEDNELNREIAAALLDQRGILYDTAENGKIGVDLFSSSSEGFYDIILMDIRMPVMNGLETAAAIRALDRDDARTVPIIALTANAYDEDIRDTAKAGMNAHLAKPFERDEFFAVLSRYSRN